MNRIVSLIVACGLATAAAAQNTRLICELSTDGGSTYASGVTAAPGQTVYIQVRVQYVGIPTVMGLAGLAFQPTLSNWHPEAGDIERHVPDPQPPFPPPPEQPLGRLLPFASAGMGATSSSGLLSGITDPGNILRFAGSKATTLTTNITWGVNSAQLTQQLGGTNFNSNSDVLVFRYRVDLGDVGNRDMLATIPLEGINHPSGSPPRGLWYTSFNATDSPNLVAEITSLSLVPGTIHVIPAPGAAALLGAACMCARRRSFA